MTQGQTEAGLVLNVSYRGRDFVARPKQEVTFGRSNDGLVKLDGLREDRRLHRCAGAFRFADRRWELHNDGDRLPLYVEVVGGLAATVEPGSLPLPLPWAAWGECRVLTTRTYCMAFRTSAGESHGHMSPSDRGARTTVGMRDSFALTPDEERMLVAMCEPRLVDPTTPAWVVPDYADLCLRLGGIKMKRAEDLIDGLVRKLSPVLAGLVGDNGGRERYRRQKIVDFALRTRAVTRSDLGLLSHPIAQKDEAGKNGRSVGTGAAITTTG